VAFQKLLVPVDFSEASSHAVRQAVALARAGAGKVTLLHVSLAPELYYGDLAAYGFVVPETTTNVRNQVRAEGMKALEKLRAEECGGVDVALLAREGYAPDEICAEAAQGGYDLVVMGTHGRTGITRALLGSVTERVLRHCKTPVLVTR
jgi:nucleotide-binding universal stress UspA family protein